MALRNGGRENPGVSFVHRQTEAPICNSHTATVAPAVEIGSASAICKRGTRPSDEPVRQVEQRGPGRLLQASSLKSQALAVFTSMYPATLMRSPRTSLVARRLH